MENRNLEIIEIVENNCANFIYEEIMSFNMLDIPEYVGDKDNTFFDEIKNKVTLKLIKHINRMLDTMAKAKPDEFSKLNANEKEIIQKLVDVMESISKNNR